MTHPHMAQQVDLGQCLLRASNSRFQLQFTATAHFSQLPSQSGCLPVKVSQWQDLPSIWTTEAPELDIRLFIRATQGLEHPVSELVADLREKLHNSPIWPELGFIVRFKNSNTAGGLDPLGPHHFTIGLCREHKESFVNKGRSLPPILQRPPDAHPPLGVPAIKLGSIDIHLEYSYSPHLEENFCDIMAYDLDPVVKFGQWHCQPKFETFAVATLTVSAQEPGFACSDHTPNHVNVSSPGRQTDGIQDTLSSPQNLLQLLDSGLQMLIISASSRRPQTRTVGKNTLQNLSRLFPAIFNPGYRKAMNQRAASIPIISKALTSMFENSSNPFLRDKLPVLQSTSNLAIETSSSSSHNTPNPAIHSTLWRIAQERTRRPSAIKKGTSFFASGPEPDPDPTQQTSIDETQLQEFLTEDDFEDIELLDVDKFDDTNHEPRNELISQPMAEPLDDSVMELMCEDSTASTQITMDDDLIMYESTQTTLDEFASTCDPIPFDHSDTEMLF